MREGLAIGRVEGFQINLPIADARFYGYDNTQQLAVFARIETGPEQLVPPFLITKATDFPNEVIIRLACKPRLQYTANAETLILTSEEVPCALQL
jgi:hypothetical protein